MLPHEAGNTQCVHVLKELPTNEISTIVRLGGESGPTFTFDQVFPLTTTQIEVYDHRVAPLVSSCLEGYNATILAYGQTGSGYVDMLILWSESNETSYNVVGILSTFLIVSLFLSAKRIPSWDLQRVFQRQFKMKDKEESFLGLSEVFLIN